MTDRIKQELALLRKHYPNLEYREEGRWVRIPSYPLPAGWNGARTDVAFQIKVEHPAAPPYGIYVPAGLRYNNSVPSNYTENVSPAPPFGGSWGIFSWYPEDGQWRPTADLMTGSNLLNWARSFANRFREGA